MDGGEDLDAVAVAQGGGGPAPARDDGLVERGGDARRGGGEGRDEDVERDGCVEDARRSAIDRLVQNATIMGANAIVMMRFDSSEIGQTMSEIVAYGTAVTIEPMPR